MDMVVTLWGRDKKNRNGLTINLIGSYQLVLNIMIIMIGSYNYSCLSRSTAYDLMLQATQNLTRPYTTWDFLFNGTN